MAESRRILSNTYNSHDNYADLTATNVNFIDGFVTNPSTVSVENIGLVLVWSDSEGNYVPFSDQDIDATAGSSAPKGGTAKIAIAVGDRYGVGNNVEDTVLTPSVPAKANMTLLVKGVAAVIKEGLWKLDETEVDQVVYDQLELQGINVKLAGEYITPTYHATSN